MSALAYVGEARSGDRARASTARIPTASDLAWIAAAPCATVTAAAILLLGPLLGRVLFPPEHPAFEEAFASLVHPEPTEHARYLLALLGPILLCGAVALAARRATRPWPGPLLDALVRTGRGLAAAAFAGAVVAQYRHWYFFAGYPEGRFHKVYFTPATLAFAAVLASGALLALRDDGRMRKVAALLRETPRKRAAASAAVALLTAAWLLAAINTDGSIGGAHSGVQINMPFWADAPFAVLDGRAPLVSFHAQYAQLLPYATAALMLLFGTSLGAFSLLMTAATAAALLAVFATLRRIVHSSWMAAALYAPFLATGFFTVIGPLENRYGPIDVYSMFPMRYGGAYALAWLTARHLDGARPRARSAVFAAAGLVAVNNPEFGVPALGASIAALALAGVRSRAGAVRFARDFAVGVAGALAAVCLLTLVVAGSLPRFGTLLEFPRIYAVDGFGMLPMPALGLHLALYGTFAAALVLAVVRTLARRRDALLTAMLAWAGVFGLGAGNYFAGRSHPDVLIDLFSAWTFALALLVVVVVRQRRAAPRRRPSVAEVAVLVGFGAAVASLAQTPTPWSQLHRLQAHAGQLARLHAEERFVAGFVERGARTAILFPYGHRIAYDLGVVNVSPYETGASIPLVRQFQDLLGVVRTSGARTLFIAYDGAYRQRSQILRRAGFRLLRIDGGTALTAFAAPPG